MQRASSETIVLDAERSFELAISRPQLSALPAELWRPIARGMVSTEKFTIPPFLDNFWIPCIYLSLGHSLTPKTV